MKPICVVQFREKQIGKRIVNMSFNIWSRTDEINRRKGEIKKIEMSFNAEYLQPDIAVGRLFYILN